MTSAVSCVSGAIAVSVFHVSCYLHLFVSFQLPGGIFLHEMKKMPVSPYGTKVFRKHILCYYLPACTFANNIYLVSLPGANKLSIYISRESTTPISAKILPTFLLKVKAAGKKYIFHSQAHCSASPFIQDLNHLSYPSLSTIGASSAINKMQLSVRRIF